METKEVGVAETVFIGLASLFVMVSIIAQFLLPFVVIGFVGWLIFG